MKRSTTDLLILMIAGTLCLGLLGSGLTVALIEILHPETDTSGAVGDIGAIVNVLVGLLAGFLAGATRRRQGDDRPPDQ